jgi:hypothetical protein
VEGMMAGRHSKFWNEWTTCAASDGRPAATLGVYPLRQ